MLKYFGPIYIDFDEYPCYSGRNSEIFEINANENIQCVHGYAYSSGKQKMCTCVNEVSWGIMKNFFPDAKLIKKFPKTVLCKECTCFQKDINENDEKIDSTEDNEPTFLSSYFLEKPVFTVETIEERLNEMKLDRIQKMR